MRTLHHAHKPCDCQSNLRQYAATQDPPFWLGSIVQCMCGRTYRLAEHQFEGPYWAPYTAPEGAHQ